MAPVEQKLSVHPCVCLVGRVSLDVSMESTRSSFVRRPSRRRQRRSSSCSDSHCDSTLYGTVPYVTVCNCVCECMDGNVFIRVCVSFCHWDSTVTQKLWHFWKQYTSTRNSQTRGGRHCFDHHLSVCLLARWLKKLSVNFHEIWGMGRLWTKDELIKIWKVRIRVV